MTPIVPRTGWIAFLTLSLSALAQVQLQFAVHSHGSVNFGPFDTYSYNRGLSLPNGDVLLIGSSYTSNRIGLYNVPVQHAQIAFASTGPVLFQNGNPPDLLPPLGGSGNDEPQAAAVDPSGNLDRGNTDSDDFNLVNPIVSQRIPYRTAGFVIELDPTGAKLLFATYLSGQQRPPYLYCTVCSYASYATAIAIDRTGAVYVGGSTNEADFPPPRERS